MSNEHINSNSEPIDSTIQPAEAVVDGGTAVTTEPSAEFPSSSFSEPLPGIEIDEAKRVLEAALMAASEPMAINELKRLFDGELSGEILRNLLDQLRDEWVGRSVELALVASGYRFRVKPEYQKIILKLNKHKTPNNYPAVHQTLPIIAYRQPVTRADIEDIRGVQVSPHILKTLQDRGWIDEIGHKEVVGRPALFATTRHFLDDLNLRSLEELPPLHELQATLDMTQAGAALSAGGVVYPAGGVVNTAGTTDDRANANPALPGMETSHIVEPVAGYPVAEQVNLEASEKERLDAKERHHG